ncbi:MAG: hypothetical protein Q4E24_12395 [bacterium]|nr:hypothetical protein [bacterium]
MWRQVPVTPAWRRPKRSVDLLAAIAGVREHGAIDFHIIVMPASAGMSAKVPSSGQTAGVLAKKLFLMTQT